MRRRVQLTVQLLSATDMPLSEIAHAAGFVDQSHCARRFRKHAGMSPRDYRWLTHSTAGKHASSWPALQITTLYRTALGAVSSNRTSDADPLRRERRESGSSSHRAQLPHFAASKSLKASISESIALICRSWSASWAQTAAAWRVATDS
jgi:hypothetical protein